jgi:hypothetical protein
MRVFTPKNGKKGAPGATRTRNQLIRSYSCEVIYLIYGLLALSSTIYGGEFVYYVHYLYSLFLGCTTVAPEEKKKGDPIQLFKGITNSLKSRTSITTHQFIDFSSVAQVVTMSAVS